MGLNRNINDDSTLAYLFNKTRQGASDALQKAIDAINATIASIQTALNNKVSKTGNETVAGVKTFSDSPKFNTDVIIKSSDRYKDIILRQNDSTNGNSGFIRMDAGDATNQTVNRFYFLEYSPKTTAATAHTGFHENYQLPAPTKGLGASVSYDILTSKSAVTIEQGGTGATTAANARTNLGLGSMATVNSPVPVANGGTGATTAADARTNLGAVNKAGDTMTGRLIMQNARIDIHNTNADTTRATDTSNRTWSIYHDDANNKIASYWESAFTTAGRMQTTLAARRVVNGSNVDNFITLKVGADGTRTVAVTNAAIWRTALGLGGMATIASPAPIANGGTGQTGITTVTTVSQIATAASGWTITSASYSYWGEIAQLKITVKPSSAPGTGETVVATLVSGKRPKLSSVALCPWLNMNYSYIETDGKIYIRTTSWPASAERWVIATFILP